MMHSSDIVAAVRAVGVAEGAASGTLDVVETLLGPAPPAAPADCVGWPGAARGLEALGRLEADLQGIEPLLADLFARLWRRGAPETLALRAGLAALREPGTCRSVERGALLATALFAVEQALLAKPSPAALLAADGALAECLVALAGLPVEVADHLGAAFLASSEVALAETPGSTARLDAGARLRGRADPARSLARVLAGVDALAPPDPGQDAAARPRAMAAAAAGEPVAPAPRSLPPATAGADRLARTGS